MIQYEAIRSALVRGLSAALGGKVIEMNGGGPAPPYPFMTYDFIDPSGEIIGHMSTVSTGSQAVQTGSAMLTVSLNSYAKDKTASALQADRARDWLLSDGHWKIRDQSGAVIVTVGAVTNRDIQIGDEWERRHGFDLELRATNTITSPITTIDTANIKEVD